MKNKRERERMSRRRWNDRRWKKTQALFYEEKGHWNRQNYKELMNYGKRGEEEAKSFTIRKVEPVKRWRRGKWRERLLLKMIKTGEVFPFFGFSLQHYKYTWWTPWHNLFLFYFYRHLPITIELVNRPPTCQTFSWKPFKKFLSLLSHFPCH